MSAPLTPEREEEIRERLASTLAFRKSDAEALLAELDRLRSETAGLRQGAERQEARTEHIAKQALRWKAEADGRKKYGEKLQAELAARPSRAEVLREAADVIVAANDRALWATRPGTHWAADLLRHKADEAAPKPTRTDGCTCVNAPETDAGKPLHASYCVVSIRRSRKPQGGAS